MDAKTIVVKDNIVKNIMIVDKTCVADKYLFIKILETLICHIEYVHPQQETIFIVPIIKVYIKMGQMD